jgi:undecaprenyl-diphosphatase
VHRQTIGITAFDKHWFHIVNGWTQISPVLNDLGKVLAKFAPEIWLVVFVLLWFWPPRVQSQTRKAVVYAVVAGVLALVINVIIGHFFYRPRPFVYEPLLVHQLLQHKPDTSFPSDHAAGSFAFAVGLFYASKKREGIFGLIFAAAIAVARVFVGLHWPTDVLAGAAIGVISGLIVLALRRQLEWLVNLGYAIFSIRPERSRYRSRMRMD